MGLLPALVTALLPLSVPVFAAETFHAPPRPAGVRLRCPLVFSQLRTAPTFWRDSINLGLVRQIGAHPKNTFFRQQLGERLENEFGDELSGKDEVRTKARGRFLSESVALEKLLEQYDVESVDQLPPHARGEGQKIFDELQQLFKKYGASWTPRIAPAKGFQFKDGVLAGVTIDLKDFTNGADAVFQPESFAAFVRKLPATIHSLEIVGGTPEQVASLLRWDTKGRFRELTLGAGLGPVDNLILTVEPHLGQVQKLRFDRAYNFNPDQLALLSPLGAKVPASGVNVEGHQFHAAAEGLFEEYVNDPHIRRITWQNLLRHGAFGASDLLLAPPAYMIADMRFLVDEPAFWKSLHTIPFQYLVALYEALPTKPAELRAKFLRQALLHLSPGSIADFVKATMTAETKTRRKVSSPGAATADVFASNLLKESRFGALRALRAIHEIQGPKESFADAQARWLADEKANVADKAAYVAREIGDPAVRAIFEGAPARADWKEVRDLVERETLYFAWKALQGEGKGVGDPVFVALQRDKLWWAFEPGVARDQQVSSVLLPLELDAMPERLNAWAAKANHPFRYEVVTVTEGRISYRRLGRRPLASE